MNEYLNSLSNKIHAPRHHNQLPDIRKHFDLYLRNMDDDKIDGGGIITLMVGALCGAGIALFFAWLIWGSG